MEKVEQEEILLLNHLQGKENQLLVEEKLFTEAELKEMDEVFICGTGSEILPVVEVDDVHIGNGEPGPVTRKIQQLFFEAVNKLYFLN